MDLPEEITDSGQALIDQVRDLASTIRKHAGESEKNRRLSREVVEAMREAGLYRMSRPRTYGGYELDPVSLYRIVEEIARHDTAAGWNVQLANAIEFVASWLPDQGSAEMLEGHPETAGAPISTISSILPGWPRIEARSSTCAGRPSSSSLMLGVDSDWTFFPM